MKYSITTSPLVPVIMAITLIYQLNFIPLFIVGGFSIYCIYFYIILIQKEKNLSKDIHIKVYPNTLPYKSQPIRKKQKQTLYSVKSLIKESLLNPLYYLLTAISISDLTQKRVYLIIYCKSFGNGLEALTYIKEEYPDIVVCDTMLHGMYGNELSSRLKTSCETSIIPIILYGSYLNGRQRNTRETSLADVFINTPFHIEDLKIEMNVLIKNSRFLRKSFLQKYSENNF